MGQIVSIVYKPQHIDFIGSDKYARLPLHTARLVEGYGIDGDRKGGSSQRQLNIMAQETLDDLYLDGFSIAPGEMGEQLIVTGLNIDSLQPGDRLQLGAALVEVTSLREGCQRFEKIQQRSAASVQGRLGVMAKVLTGGYICIGTVVEVLEKITKASGEYV